MSKTWLKKLSLPVLAMLFIYYASNDPNVATQNLVDTMTNQENVPQVNLLDEEYYAVYALHESDHIVKTYVSKQEESDPVLAVFELLTTKSNQLPIGTTSLISPMTRLIDYSIEEEVLTLNLSKEFLTYDPQAEQQVLESLVWSFTEIPGIERVKFEIENEPVSNLNGALAVGRGLTRDMGVNLELDTASLDNTQLVTVYFMTDDSQNAMLVPVTRLIPNSVDPIDYAVNALIQGATSKDYISVFDHQTTLLSSPTIQDGLISLNFSSELYYDQNQTLVSSLMLKQLVMTLTEFDEIESVSVAINGNMKVLDDASRSVVIPTSRMNFEPVKDAN